MDDREPLGRVVHDTRLACEAEQAAEEGRHRFDLGEWETRTGWQREVDMRVGSAVAAQARADAQEELNVARMQLAVFRAHLPAVLDALAYTLANLAGRDAPVRRYRAALAALGGGEEEGS